MRPLPPLISSGVAVGPAPFTSQVVEALVEAFHADACRRAPNAARRRGCSAGRCVRPRFGLPTGATVSPYCGGCENRPDAALERRSARQLEARGQARVDRTLRRSRCSSRRARRAPASGGRRPASAPPDSRPGGSYGTCRRTSPSAGRSSGPRCSAGLPSGATERSARCRRRRPGAQPSKPPISLTLRAELRAPLGAQERVEARDLDARSPTPTSSSRTCPTPAVISCSTCAPRLCCQAVCSAVEASPCAKLPRSVGSPSAGA